MFLAPPIRTHPTGRRAPFVAHIASLGADFPAREAIAPALESVARQVDPLAVSFFELAGSQISSSVVYGSGRPPAELADRVQGWKVRLRATEPLAPSRIAALPGRIVTPADVEERRGGSRSGPLRRLYREIGAVNDLRVPIRDQGRLIAGLTVWRRFGESAWTAEQLRPLEALQPLIERAYLNSLRSCSAAVAPLPKVLTRRQREVARLLATGASNADVACALHISPNTVKSHTRVVFATLGVASRRELAMRFSPAGASAASGEGPDEIAEELLGTVLEWSGGRLGAALGGCLLISPRGEPVAESWGCAPRRGGGHAAEGAEAIHELIAAPDETAGVLLSAERSPWTVARLDAVAPGCAERAFALTGELGLGMPTLLCLRTRGRLAGLLWLCREAGPSAGQPDAEAQLRAVQPLVELCVADGGAGPERGARAGGLDITSRGLSERELTVARLALAGEGNAAIALRLGVAEATVKKHMTRILGKCEVRSRTELIATLTGPRTTFG